MKTFILLTLIFSSPTFAESFTSRFYQQMAKGSAENINFSPLSLKMALDLVYRGASGDTKKFFEKEFGFSENNFQPFKKEYDLVASLSKENAPMQLQLSNSVWFRDSREIETGYLKEMKLINVSSGKLDVKAMNDWVSTSTHGKISRLLDAIDPSMFVVFMNAIYFKADWNLPFEKDNTHQENFSTAPGKTEKVPMMNQTKRFNYFEDQSSKWVRLAYRDSPLVMLLGLPKKRFALKTLEKNFSEEKLKKIEEKMGSFQVILSVPKFKFDQKGSVKGTLLKMGLAKLFKASDYARLSKNPALNISDIIQATNITVDEEGTEAAAATAVVMLESSMAHFGEKPKVFNADQPFLFVLKNEQSGEVYFMGRVVKP